MRDAVWMFGTCLLVAGAVAGCGKTRVDPRAGASSGAGASSEAGSSSGGAASRGGEAGAPEKPVSCAYPVAGPSFDGQSVEAGFRLSETQALPVAANAWRGFAGAYDVNGDDIEDLVYREAAGDRTSFHFLVSSVGPGASELPLEPFACPELEALPTGRLFLRDLNDDGAPDFIIATNNGLRIFANLPGGFESLLDYGWDRDKQYGRWAALHLAMADLTGDGRRDIAIGYDRILDSGEVALGMVVFVQYLDGTFGGANPFEAYASEDAAARVPLGDLAAGRFRDGQEEELFSPVGVNVPTSDGYLGDLGGAAFGDPHAQVHTEPAVAGLIPFRVFALPGAGPTVALAVGSADQLSVFSLREAVAVLETQTPLYYEHQTFTHDLGAGDERSQQLLVDIDRDGDLDFVELSPGVDQAFAIHANVGSHRFADPVVLDGNLRSGAESPFFKLGPISGVVLGALDSTPAVATIIAQ